MVMSLAILGSVKGCAGETQQQLYKDSLKKKKTKLVTGPRWVPEAKIDWPTDRRSYYNFHFDLTPREYVGRLDLIGRHVDGLVAHKRVAAFSFSTTGPGRRRSKGAPDQHDVSRRS
jgi:hypothetical protein